MEKDKKLIKLFGNRPIPHILKDPIQLQNKKIETAEARFEELKKKRKWLYDK